MSADRFNKLVDVLVEAGVLEATAVLTVAVLVVNKEIK